MLFSPFLAETYGISIFHGDPGDVAQSASRGTPGLPTAPHLAKAPPTPKFSPTPSSDWGASGGDFNDQTWQLHRRISWDFICENKGLTIKHVDLHGIDVDAPWFLMFCWWTVDIDGYIYIYIYVMIFQGMIRDCILNIIEWGIKQQLWRFRIKKWWSNWNL